MSTEEITQTVTAATESGSLTVGTLVLALIVLVVSWAVAGWLRRKLRKYLEGHEGLNKEIPTTLSRAAGWVVKSIGILVALNIVGFDTNPVILILLIVAGGIALTGKGILENLAAGVILQMRGPFRVGDRIEAKGYTGKVQTINSRSVVIVTGDRRTVHVPNVDFLSDPIVNYTAQPDRRSQLDIGVAYDTDLKAAKALLVKTAVSVDGVHADPAPSATIEEFDDSSVLLALQFWHDDGKRSEVRDAVAEACKDALDAAGVEMPYPRRVVIHGDKDSPKPDDGGAQPTT